jgi:hypothetical protein
VVSGSKFKITSISEFNEIAKREEIFFWHFIAEEHQQMTTTIKPMFYEKNPDENFLIEYQKIFNIKIYESFTKDSYDFLINQGYKSKNLFTIKNTWLPEFLGFKKGLLIDATHLFRKCYCPSGILEVIRNTDPKTFESVLGIEKENLE